MMKKKRSFFFKGIAIGAANIVPGVSGGTIALITGLFERLIHAVKSFNLTALKLFFTGRFKTFAQHTDLLFLVLVFAGAGTGVYSLAFILEPLLQTHPVYVWAFFFGLILASAYFVGGRVSKWTAKTIFSFVLGTLAAISITMLIDPAAENGAPWYLFICGVLAMCSMILPGLSGSFVLILMGNYELIMVQAIKHLEWAVILPVAAGAICGLLVFSHVLSWIFKRHKDMTISLLTGFILGSLGILWPWKHEVIKIFAGGKEKVVGYEWFLPHTFNPELILALGLILAGAAMILLVERWLKSPSVST